jgi:hypothetical protein
MNLQPANVPQWLLARFNAIYKDPPHYEASYYGPVNALLTAYFPPVDGFLVKPQTRLRQPPAPGGRTSTDSQGQQVGTFDNDGNPDFLVSIGSAQLHHDIPLLICELKKEEYSTTIAGAQMDRYVVWAKEYQRQIAQHRDVWAVLVIGSESYTYFLPANSTDIIAYDVLVNTTGPEIMMLLQSIRTNA